MGNVRQHGRGWQLRYQVWGERVEETVRVKTRTEALQILKVRHARAYAKGNPERVMPTALEY